MLSLTRLDRVRPGLPRDAGRHGDEYEIGLTGGVDDLAIDPRARPPRLDSLIQSIQKDCYGYTSVREMSKTGLRMVETEAAPTTVMDTGELRRAYLSKDEVEEIIKAARNERDRLMILMAYRHGLRVSELIGLRVSQLDLDTGRLRVVRQKGSEDSVHPLSGREIRSLRKLRRGMPVGAPFVFVTSRGGPFTRNGFYKLLARAGEAAGIAGVHPHLLRHGCGFKLVNDGVDTLSLAAYLGHKNVQNTRVYTKMSSTRFDGFWKE